MNDKENLADSDEVIVERILINKDTRDFQIIYNRYVDKVYRKCIGFTHDHDEANDLTHDILLKLYLSLDKFKGSSKFSTWVYSITYNFCIDNRRKLDSTRKKMEEYAAHDDQYDNESDDSALFEVKVEVLKKVLELIDPEEKALLLMKYQDDLSIKPDIMSITNLSEGAIKMRLKRAKEKVIKLSNSQVSY